MHYFALLQQRFLIISYLTDGALRSAWMYNIQSESWSPLPSMRTARSYIHCGVIHRTRSDGTPLTEVVVAGGADGVDYIRLVEIFDVERNSWSFTTDPFPTYISGGSAASYYDSFIIVGGLTEDRTTAMPTIFQYQPEDHTWNLLGLALEFPRHSFALIPVPDSIGDC